MSHDEQMAIIGRMVVEKQELDRRGIALNDELRRIAKGLESIANTLETSSIYAKEFFRLTDEQRALLNADQISALLAEIGKTGKRYHEIKSALERAGLNRVS